MKASAYRLAGAVMLVASCSVSAQQSGGAAPDISAGKKRAAVCFACHGENGIAKIPATPHLAGQNRSYLEKALLAYRGGQLRQDTTMTAMAKSLSDADITNIAAYFSLLTRMDTGQTVVETLETRERIKPVGAVQYASETTPVTAPASLAMATNQAAAEPRAGDTIFNTHCATCHTTGAAGAPKLGDQAAWMPRINQGKKILYQHALQGIRAMPPNGSCTTCSDEEIKITVDYLVAKSRE